MKTGRTLQEIAVELDRQLHARRDYVAPASALSLRNHGERVGLALESVNGGEPYPLTDHAHDQIADHVEIPRKYYERMLADEPGLLAQNVNTWLRRRPGVKRLVRTLDGRCRAFLSSNYRPLDNYDLAEIVLPVLHEKRCEVVSAELTEQRLYLKAILPEVSLEVRGSRQRGDVVQAGIVVSNSEIGAGAVKVEPLIFRLACLNGMIVPDASLRKYHIGKGADAEGVTELLTSETRQADDRAFWLKVRDIVRAAFDRDVFAAMVERLSAAASERIEGADMARVVEVVSDRLALPERVNGPILRHLIEGGDLSRWGLVNAVTAVANTEEDYEAATELERAGGRILDLSSRDWHAVAQAA